MTLATLQPTPIDDSTEYVATVKSLRSTPVRPQVEGIITRIDVTLGPAGARRRPPAAASMRSAQATAVSSQEATRAALEADLALARTELERSRIAGQGRRRQPAGARPGRGAASSASRPRRGAIQSQVREARVQLQYFDVVAPAAGIVGDVPVRVGNRVTPADVLTTIDENATLEVQVNVPLERAPRSEARACRSSSSTRRRRRRADHGVLHRAQRRSR